MYGNNYKGLKVFPAKGMYIFLYYQYGIPTQIHDTFTAKGFFTMLLKSAMRSFSKSQ